MRTIHRLATALLACAAAAPAAAVTVFFDDFATYSASDWVFSTNYGGSAGVDRTLYPGALAPFIDAPPGGSNLIARSTRTLNLLAGDYSLSLDALSVPCSGCTISYDVLFNGTSLTRTASAGAFQSRIFNLGNLAAGVHTLTLGMHTTSASSGHFLAAFDNVRIEGSNLVDPVPEPASWALLISGFGLVGAVQRRRRAAAAA